MKNLFINLTITTVLVTSILPLVLQTTVKAKDTDVECKKAVANATSRLQKIPNVLIYQAYTKNLNEYYSDFPQGRPIEYVFYLTGPERKGRAVETGIKKVENSKQFMKNISQDIISKCSSIGAVVFTSTFAPSCSIAFGLMRDGKFKAFDTVIIDPNQDTSLKWGQTFCW
ncbi:hypothetical protein [Aphanizomenon sp. UHCC 0183]|uniref:hypothetical protein n=1 Tax=Aphanizomenon sp. UHCC 0183 TaxID=2590028 RepID=UPI0014462604|nr:hypothetical protein [Aphanizomenon sp. UHCC 0183]MTJ29108.1 hypothetical protein [Aphanizomenon sp. UHCC 0183]